MIPDCSTTAPQRRSRAAAHISISHHVHQELPSQLPDTKAGDYYVSVQNGNSFALLLGPFKDNHAEALSLVDAVRAAAAQLDGRAHWYSFGTCRLDTPPETMPGNRMGSLNQLLGYSTTKRDVSGTGEA